MYSRFPPERREKIRLPEHYSGCAFSPDRPYPPPAPEDREKTESRERTTVDQKDGGHKESRGKEPEISPTEAQTELLDIEKAQKESTSIPSVEQNKHTGLSLFGDHGLSIPIGLSFDELLLIGLILLLARSESDSDVIVWLVLLLFCK